MLAVFNYVFNDSDEENELNVSNITDRLLCCRHRTHLMSKLDLNSEP